MAGRPCAESIPRRWPLNKVKIILLILIGTGAYAGMLGSQTISEAAKKGDIAALKAILATNPGLVIAPGENGKRDCAEILLSRGAAADTRDEMNCTLLPRAVLGADPEIYLKVKSKERKFLFCRARPQTSVRVTVGHQTGS